MKSSTCGLVLSVLKEMLSDQETLWQEYGCIVYSIGFNLGLFILSKAKTIRFIASPLAGETKPRENSAT